MSIIEPIIRPPSEAESFLLQITTGCSSNSCSFCGAYLNKSFRIKNIDEIFTDINEGQRLYPFTRKVFLMDGDALVLNNDKIIPILKKIKNTFPKLSKISSYANGYNITKRTDDELKELYENKLQQIYIGLESGSQVILDYCNKRSTVEEMIYTVNRGAKFNIKSSVIVLLGLGGKKFSDIHVKDTIIALNKMQPRYLSFLSVILVPGTLLHKEMKKGDFKELNSVELLQEMYDIINGLQLNKTIFRSNHASNYLALEGRFPQNKNKLLNIIESAIKGKVKLRPEFIRGL